MRNTLVALCLLGCASIGHAALGGAPNPVAAGNAASTAKSFKAASATAGYSIKTATLENGTTVQEFVGTDGIVFAVTWKGAFQPNLKELLGSHFSTMTKAAQARPMAGNSQLSVKDSDVVILSSGHMRSVSGRAWIPSLLPSGVTPDDIQ